MLQNLGGHRGRSNLARLGFDWQGEEKAQIAEGGGGGGWLQPGIRVGVLVAPGFVGVDGTELTGESEQRQTAIGLDESAQGVVDGRRQLGYDCLEGLGLVEMGFQAGGEFCFCPTIGDAQAVGAGQSIEVTPGGTFQGLGEAECGNHQFYSC